MKTFIDQLQRSVNINFPAKKIISLVPSQTELLYDLGLRDEVIGITKFCIHPDEWFRNKTRIGGTKNVDINKITELKPDLIIANKEENTKGDIEELEKIAPVWISDIFNLNDALNMIQSLGSIVNKELEAKNIVDEITLEFNLLNNFITNQSYKTKTCCYLIWQNPFITIGADTFINNMLNLCGFENVFANQNRYPTTSLQEICSKKPDLIMLSSEPFPFKEKHINELQDSIPDSKIILVDGEMFSWYGSRLVNSPKYFLELLKQLKN